MRLRDRLKLVLGPMRLVLPAVLRRRGEGRGVNDVAGRGGLDGVGRSRWGVATSPHRAPRARRAIRMAFVFTFSRAG